MYSRDPHCQILYCYGIYQPLFDEMERTIKNLRSKQGLPSSEELEDFTMDRRHKLIVIDDLVHRVVEDKQMELLLTQGTHHKCVSVILITQNLYPRRETRQDHSFKYVVLGIDEEFERRQLYILGDRTLGYQRKVEALGGKHASKDSVGPFEIGARIMQKLVLVP